MWLKQANVKKYIFFDIRKREYENEELKKQKIAQTIKCGFMIKFIVSGN